MMRIYLMKSIAHIAIRKKICYYEAKPACGRRGEKGGASMQKELIERLSVITEEEQRILAGTGEINRSIFTAPDSFIVDADKLMGRGELVAARHHARFAPYPQHSHNYVEMIYMCSGATTHIINGKERVELRTGNILLLNRHTSHAIETTGQEDIAVNFVMRQGLFDLAMELLDREDPLSDFVSSSLRSREERGFLLFNVAHAIPVQNLMENLVWSILNRPNNSEKINRATLPLLFIQLVNYLDKLVQTSDEDYERALVLKALEYVETSYRDASLGELSAMLNQSVSQLSRLISRQTGRPFSQHLQQAKFQAALRLLRESDLPVADIAAAVGYSNQSFFYRCFHNRFGCTPREYRLAQQKKEDQ